MYWRVYAIRYIVLSYMLVATPVVEFQDCCQLLCMCNEVWKDGVTMCNLRSICWWVELLCILSKGFQNGSLDDTLCNLRSIQNFLFYIFFNTSYWGEWVPRNIKFDVHCYPIFEIRIEGSVWLVQSIYDSSGQTGITRCSYTRRQKVEVVINLHRAQNKL